MRLMFYPLLTFILFLSYSQRKDIIAELSTTKYCINESYLKCLNNELPCFCKSNSELFRPILTFDATKLTCEILEDNEPSEYDLNILDANTVELFF